MPGLLNLGILGILQTSRRLRWNLELFVPNHSPIRSRPLLLVKSEQHPTLRNFSLQILAISLTRLGPFRAFVNVAARGSRKMQIYWPMETVSQEKAAIRNEKRKKDIGKWLAANGTSCESKLERNVAKCKKGLGLRPTKGNCRPTVSLQNA